MNKGISALLKDIVENILIDSMSDNTGIFWETITNAVNKGQVSKGTRYGLDYGTTGIAHFLLEYYEFYEDKRLKSIIEKVLLKVYEHCVQDPSFIGFYNGRGGVIFTFLKANQLFPELGFLEKAYQLSQIEITDVKNYNLESGLSGLLLGISHLYNESNRYDLILLIDQLISKIVKGAKIHSKGIYWDELEISTYPPTGFLYGNSGVVFALRMASNFFTNPSSLDKMIDEAIDYEDATFSEKEDNWPDFINEDGFLYNYDFYNKLTFSKRKYSEEKFSYNFSTSWGIGSPGTLLSRRKSIQKNKHYNEAFIKANSFFVNGLRNASADFGLYRGLGGIYITLKHLGANLDRSEIVNYLEKQKIKYSEFLCSYPGSRKLIDLSLFRGEAGIGYLLLRILVSSKEKSSLLFPCIVTYLKTKKDALSIDISQTILESNCPLSIKSDELYNEDSETFYSQIISRSHQLKESELKEIQNILSIEKFKLKCRDINFRFEGYLTMFNQNKKKIEPKFLKLSPNVSLPKVSGKRILIRTIDEIHLISLDEMTFKLVDYCSNFSKSRTNDVIKYFMKDLSFKNKRVKKNRVNQIQALIIHCIRNGLLRFE